MRSKEQVTAAAAGGAGEAAAAGAGDERVRGVLSAGKGAVLGGRRVERSFWG